MKKLSLALLFLLFVGCAPSNIAEFRAEGEGHIKCLIRELAEIETPQQLEKKQPRLKKQFATIVHLMIAAKKFHLRHPEEEVDVTTWQLELSDALKQEMVRIYEIEGCAELMEEIQRDAVHRLDLFERRIAPPQ